MEKEYISARYRKQIDKFKDETYEILLKDERFCFAKGVSLKEVDEMNKLIKNKIDERFNNDLSSLINLICLSENLDDENAKSEVLNLLNEILLDFKSEASYETLKRYRFSKKFLKWGVFSLVVALIFFAIIFAVVLGTR